MRPAGSVLWLPLVRPELVAKYLERTDRRAVRTKKEGWPSSFRTMRAHDPCAKISVEQASLPSAGTPWQRQRYGGWGRRRALEQMSPESARSPQISLLIRTHNKMATKSLV